MNKLNTAKKIRLNFKKIRTFKFYDIFGSHETTINGNHGVRFILWAPKAKEVRVVGDFNNWSGSSHIMKKHKRLGVWVLFIAGLKSGDIYKYEILTQSDKKILKSDPTCSSRSVRCAWTCRRCARTPRTSPRSANT
jgi:1,4-alpha-glucan branching enzyme